MNYERKRMRARFKSEEKRRSVGAVGRACTHFRRKDPFTAPRWAIGGGVARVEGEEAPVKQHAEESKGVKNLVWDDN